jgi:EmrB/QacA subfamily drug resistance transporter
VRRRLYTAENRKWWTLGAVAFGLFMIMLDNTVVNVAAPAIQRDLGVGLSELEWIVAGYALSFAALMLTGGKLADLMGRRRIFVLGIVIFTVSSLFCGMADSGNELIGWRIVQGVGAALMNPATLAIIAATFPPRERGTAIGIWAGVSALALAIGPLVGGLITEHASWNWVFLINVPVGILGIVASYLLIDESRDMSENQRLDLTGLVLSGAGLFSLTYALIEANTYGWTSTRILALFGAAAVLLVGFVVWELRTRFPMLDLTLFRNGTFAGANAVVLLVGFAMFGIFFYVSLYMQNILGFSAVQAGASFLPIGSRWLMTSGMTLLGIQLLYYSTLGTTAGFFNLLPGLLIGGLGMSLTMTPSAAAVIGSVPVDKAGVGSAVMNSMRQVGGSLGIAALGAILAHGVAGRTTPEAFVDGYSMALRVGAIVTLTGAVVAAATVRKVRHEPVVAAAEAA